MDLSFEKSCLDVSIEGINLFFTSREDINLAVLAFLRLNTENFKWFVSEYLSFPIFDPEFREKYLSFGENLSFGPTWVLVQMHKKKAWRNVESGLILGEYGMYCWIFLPTVDYCNIYFVMRCKPAVTPVKFANFQLKVDFWVKSFSLQDKNNPHTLSPVDDINHTT